MNLFLIAPFPDLCLLVPFFGRALPLDGLEESSKVMFIGVHESCNKFLTSLVVVSTNTFLKLPPRNFPIQSSRVKFISRRSRTLPDSMCKKVQVGNNQENAQSEKDSHSKNRGGKKTKLTIFTFLDCIPHSFAPDGQASLRPLF